MSMYNYSDADRYDDSAFFDGDDEAPECVCADYAGAAHVTYCKACKQWTDETEMQIMAEETAITPRKPVVSVPEPRYAEVA